MCYFRRSTVTVALVKTKLNNSLSVPLRTSRTVLCFGSEGNKKEEDKTKDASWGIPGVLEELILCVEQ